jgi:uncharacterized protein (DUF1501 family)
MTQQTRREFFLKTGCAAMGAAAITATMDKMGLMTLGAQMSAPSDYKALVCLLLNGGNDANNLVIPTDPSLSPTDYVTYNAYYNVRNQQGLAIPLANLTNTSILPSNTGGKPFAFHPSLGNNVGGSVWSGVRDLFPAGDLAVVANVGTLVEPTSRTTYRNGTAKRPYQLFSHSDQIGVNLTGKADTKVPTGWAGRMADKTVSFNGGNSFPIVMSVSGSTVFGTGVQTRGLAVGTGNLNQVFVLNGFSTGAADVTRRQQYDFLRTLDQNVTNIKAAAGAVNDGLNYGQAFSTDPAVPANAFPNTGLGNQFRQVAKIITLNSTSPLLGLNRQVFFLQIGGFDTHQNQLGAHLQLYQQISEAMRAFYNYMATTLPAYADRVVTFTMSDFGRTFQPSGSGGGVGTDHAWGYHALVMGPAVLGGQFAAINGPNGLPFPDLQLAGPYDTDTRGRWIPQTSADQYCATLARWFGVSEADMPYVFPNIDNFNGGRYLNFL